MELSIETVTGATHRIRLPTSAPNEPLVRHLNVAIAEQLHVPSYHQALVFAGYSLDEPDRSLSSYGITNQSTIKLMLLARSGPSDIAVTTTSTQTQTVAANAVTKTRRAAQKRSINISSQDHGSLSETELDMSFTVERQESARRRADDNLRTMQRMREIRRNMERIRINRKNDDESTSSTRYDPDLPSTSASGAPVVSSSTTSNTVPFSYGASAPEDTSAKESSAGETEYEDLVNYNDLPKQWYAPIGGPTTSTSGAQTGGVGRPSIHHHHHHHGPAAAGIVFRQHTRSSLPIRFVSSSSDHEDSSGAVWTTTGSELEEEEMLYSAADDLEFSPISGNTPDVGVNNDASTRWNADAHRDTDDRYFSGSPDLAAPVHETSARSRTVEDTIQTPSDPSELSSGMVICELSRRIRLKKRHHHVLSGAAAKDRRTHHNVRPSSAKGPRPRSRTRNSISGVMLPNSVSHPVTGGGHSGAQPLYIATANANNPTTAALLSTSKTARHHNNIDSSSDDNNGGGKPMTGDVSRRLLDVGVGPTTPVSDCVSINNNNNAPSTSTSGVPASTSNPTLANTYRKASGSSTRGNTKHRIGSSDTQVIRQHRLPQSSQSQQRCNTCGLKLKETSGTFQCRCGKTLCARHRHPDTHTCSYDMSSRDTKLRQLARVTDRSD